METLDRLDLEHYIDSFVSAEHRTHGSVKVWNRYLLERLAGCLTPYAVGIDRRTRVLCSTVECLKVMAVASFLTQLAS